MDSWSDRPNFTPPGHRGRKRARLSLRPGGPAGSDEFALESATPWRRLRLGCLPPSEGHLMQEATSLAARADVAIVFAGLTNEWESEGYDRPDMELRGPQVELIEKVIAANPNTVVVLNTGSPITMPWLPKAAAVVQAWYAGQEAGHALADVLFGDANPIRQTAADFPQRLQDNPAYINYPGENGEVVYGEGLFVGYRYYDKKDIAPLFPFGYGLSYAAFAYRHLQLSAAAYPAGEPIRVTLEVENTGKRAGQEVVQLYIRDIKSALARPEKELKAFAKVMLAPGQVTTVTFTLDESALAYYDPALQALGG